MKCTASTKAGNPCQRHAHPGAVVCVRHGAAAPQVRAKAAVRVEIAKWRLGDATDDPGETLLRLITQSRRRADLLADEIEQLIAQTPNLRDALVGETWIPTDAGSYKAGEYVRGLATLESAERDRLAGFCAKAIAAGLAERIVRVREREAATAHAALVAGLDEAGITGEVRRLVLSGAARHLRLVAG